MRIEEGEMSSRRRRRHPLSPAAAPLDDDDLLSEILLRLPPQPSSLPRASLVCRRWRVLVSDPRFARRFRLHHRRNPPLLGFLHIGFRTRELSFLPALEPPNRVPPGRFSLKFGGDGDPFALLGCRHGLVLVYHASCKQILVWDPVTADQHRIAVPPRFARDDVISGAVLRAAGDAQHFHVALTVLDDEDKQHRRALACVYSSETGLWGDLVSTLLPCEASASMRLISCKAAVLVRNSLYWVLFGNLDGFLEFDLERQVLAVIRMPMDLVAKGSYDICVMQAEDGGLGLFCVLQLDYIAQLWKRKTDCHGVASWVLGRTIELDKLIPMNLPEKMPVVILGFAEDNNGVCLWTPSVFFMVHLESLQSKKLLEANFFFVCRPFESVYTAETDIGGGHDGAGLLQNT
ncbi:putative F-box/kelch-repeat protein At3g17280 [Triticum dicoccoides]|uniref:putative F-box/kelch-repeat protein At3g17280 n=1 Tax=Triticum dicoccoides TaxID=85692 RepID=UPI0018917F43|nr:putative F-box/kelch-repeat protein At3g17280 [Triticum dicoccoides]